MKTTSTTPKNLATLTLLAALMFAATKVQAADYAHQGSTANLNTTGAWIGGTVPTVSDRGYWGNGQNTGTTPVALGGNLNFDGILYSNCANPQVISSDGNTLTIGPEGIIMAPDSVAFNLNNLVNLGASQAWNVQTNQTLTVSGVISGAPGTNLLINAAGGSYGPLNGTVTLNPTTPETYAGATIIDGGTLRLSYTNASTPANGIISSSSPLIFGSDSTGTTAAGHAGNLSVVATGAASQTFNGASFVDGITYITNNLNGATSSTLALGALTRNKFGGTADFDITGTTNTSPITTTTANNSGGTLGGWATVGGANWAVNSNNIIVPLGTYTAMVPSGGSPTANYSMSASTTLSANETIGSLKLSGGTITVNTLNLTITNGLLVTANSSTASAGGNLVGANGELNLYIASGTTLTFGQSGTNGVTSGTNGVTLSGPGTMVCNWNGGSMGFTGPLIMHQGNLTGNLALFPQSYVELDAGALIQIGNQNQDFGTGSYAQVLAGGGAWIGNSGGGGPYFGANAVIVPGGTNNYGYLTIGGNPATGNSTTIAGSTMLFDLSRIPGGTNNDTIYFGYTSGALTMSGTVTNVINPMDGTLGVGTYYLVAGNQNNGVSGTPTFVNNFPYGGCPGSGNYSISIVATTPKSMILTVTSTNSMPGISGVAGPTVSSGSTSGSLAYSAASGSATFYAIQWSPAALGAGFANVASTANTFSSGGGSVTVSGIPGGASPGTYTGTLITSVGAVGSANPSSSTPFTVTISACTPATAYAVTGGTNCSTSGVTVGLANSQTGYNYGLYLGSTGVGATQAGSTGSALNFGLQTTAGTYTIWATNTSFGCTAQMQGNALVSQNPTTTYNVTGGGCSGLTPSVGLSSSDVGVTYLLLLNGSQVAVTNGTGSALTFLNQTAAGTYTFEGTNVGCGVVAISGGSPASVTVTGTPNAPTLGSLSVSSGQVVVNWTAPSSGATPTSYNIYRSTTSGSQGTLIESTNYPATSFTDNGTNGDVNDTAPANGTPYYYEVTAVNGSCEGAASTQTGATPNPTFSGYKITDSGNGSATAGVGDTLTITAVNSDTSTATGVSGPIALTFSGLSAAPDGSTASFTTTTPTFSSGVATVTLTAHDAQSTTLGVSDTAGHSTTSTGGAGLALTVSAGADSAYRLTGTPPPQVGVNFTVNINLVDQYRNPSSTTASKPLVFTDATLPAGTDGSASTVNGVASGASGAAVSITSGSGSVILVAHKSGAGGTLTASDGTITTSGTGGATLAVGTITASATATRLSVTTNPAPTTLAVGTAFTTAPVIQVCDLYLNPISSTLTITAAAAVGNLQGTTSVPASGGLATFSGLSLTNVGTNTLTFSSGALTATNSPQITVTAGTITGLAWLAQPGNAVYSTVFGTAPVLATVDKYGNPSTNGLGATLTVTVTNSSGPGTLIGTTSYNIGSSGSNGIVTFNNLAVTNATGNNYQLTASIPSAAGSPVSGMAVWLDASQTNTVVGPYTALTRWNDLSGNNYNFGVPEGTAPYYTNTLNGLHVVTFNANGALLTTNGAYGNTTVNATIFTVVRHQNAGWQSYEGPVSSVAAGQGQDWNSIGSWSIDARNNGTSGQASAQRNSADIQSPSTVAASVPFIWEGAWSSVNNLEYVGFDSGSVSNITTTAWNSQSFAITQLSVGARMSGVNGIMNDWLGDVGEVLVYNTYLTTAQQSQIYGYLNNKWISGGYFTPAASATTATFTVAAAPITITGGITANSQSYNGSTNATLTIGTVTFSGVFSQDTGIIGLNTSGAVGYFANPGPGASIPVTVTGIIATGSDATNYVVSPLILSANITAPVGGYNGFAITDADSGSAQAGVGDQLTIMAETNGVEATNVDGNISVTFSGLSTAPDGSKATVTDVNGAPQPFGTAMVLFFTNGVASTANGAGLLVAHDAQTASPHISDGTYSDATGGGSTVSIAVAPGPDSAYRISATTSTPQAGVGDALTINLVDKYQNPSATTGGKTLTFSGLSTASSGATPTVNGTAFGTGTSISFTSGSASGTLIAVKAESGKLLAATDGALSTTTTGGAAPTLSPTAGTAAGLGIITFASTNDIAGTPFAQQPVLGVYDAYQNLVTSSTALITVSAAVDNVTGTFPTNAVGGVATFSGLMLTNVGTNTLTYSSGGLTSTNSRLITVTGGAYTGLAWLSQPASAVYGSVFTNQPVLATVDQYGNPTTNGLPASLSVTISASGGVKLAGTTNYNIGSSVSNGVVTTTGLGFLSGTGTSPTLTASIAGYGAPVSGMAIWLDANNTSSVMLNSSGTVTNWLDLSGNHNNFTNLAATQIYYTNSNPGFSGRKSITFGGVSELFNVSYVNTSPNLSFFVVYKEPAVAPAADDYARAAATWAGNTGNDDYQNNGSFNYDTGANNNQARAVRNEGANGDLTGPTVNWSTNFFDDEFLANSSSNVLYVNGSFGAENTGGVGAFNIVATSVGGGIGDAGAGANNGTYIGDVAEMLVYSSALTTAQRQAVETYINEKWQGNAYSSSNNITATTAGISVAPATLTITSGISVTNEVYNGTTNAPLNFTNTVTFTGVIAQDTGNVGVNTSGAVGYFANAGPGNSIPVTVTGITTTGSAGANYVVAPLILSANITPGIAGFGAFTITDADAGSAQAGVGDQLTITTETNGVVETNVDGNVSVTFSGLSAAPDGSKPTVTDVNGTPQPFGTPMVLFFTNGVASTANGAGVLVAHAAETASPHITDGMHTDAGPGGSTVSITVSPGPDNAYYLSAATLTPQVGAADALSLSIVDEYRNLSATSGNKSIVFGGLSIGPNGTAPTVNGTALGTATAITFNSGAATASLVAYKAESGKLLAATDGTLSTAAAGGGGPTLSPVAGTAAGLGLTGPSATAAAGVAFAPQPVVTILDAYGNVVNTSAAAVSVSAAVGNVSGPVPTNAVSGVATFSSLSLTNVGTNTLTFTAGGFSTNSAVITVSAGPITGLAWLTQPAGAVYSTVFGTAPVVATVDHYGNPSTNGLAAGLTVTVTNSSGPGKLSGTLSYNLGSSGGDGVATFSNLSVTNATGTNYQLTAASTAGSAVTAVFAVAPAPITVTGGITANSRLFNGTTNASLTIGTVTFSGVFPQDTGVIGLNTAAAAGYFANAGPGAGIPVTVTGIVITGGDATNYLLAPLGLTASILPTYSAFTLTDAGAGSATAGVGDQLTITTVETNDDVNTNVTGTLSVTFSGLAAGPDGSLPTVTDQNGTPQPFGTALVLNFVNGIASTANGAGVLVAHDAQTATLHITDGVHTDASPGGSTVSITVSPGPDSAYRIGAATSTPVVGAGDALTLNLVDQYQNPSATTGGKTLTFGGLSAGPNGSQPSVNGTPLGTGTVISFTGGSATATLVAVKVESGRLLTATDGLLSAASAGGTAPTLSPTVGLAAALGISAQPSSTALAGVPFAAQPVVSVLDAYGNPVTGSTALITVSAASGTVLGTYPTNAVNGVAAFAGLSLTNSGTNTLTFSSGGLISTNSAQFTILGGPVTGVAWLTQPAGAVYRTVFGTGPVLAAVDQYGNATTNGLGTNVPVTVALTAGPGALSGTTAYNLGTAGSNGVVSFENLSINAVSNNFVLTATVPLPANVSPPVSGAAVWLDASDTNSVIGGATVARWNDKSGNNYNFGVVPSGSSGTIYYTNTLNGRPVVTFPGTAALLTTNNAYTYTGTNLTLFCVVRAPAGTFGSYEGPVSSIASGPGQDADWDSPGCWSLNGGGGGNPTFQRDNGTVSSSIHVTTANPFIWEAADNGPGDSELVGYEDASTNVVTPGTPGSTGAFAITQLAIGSRLQGTGSINNQWTGDIAEVLVYHSYLSTNQQAAVNAYLYNKWIGNGTPVSVSTAVFTVAPAPLTITNGIAANNKNYDGTTNDTLTIGTVGFSGVFAPDSGNVSLNTAGAVGYFANAGPGTGIPVTVTGITLTGSAAGDYAVAPLALTANIISASPTYAAFKITGSAGATAGVGEQLTIATVDTTGNVVTGINSNITVTVSGLAAAPNGSQPVVTDVNGTPQTLGTAMVLSFVNGVASTASGAGVLTAYAAQTASPHITDGNSTDTGTGGSTVSITVAAGPDSAYRISAATLAPQAGVGDTLTLNLVDQYQNPSATTGGKTLTFGGLSAGPDGALPAVNGTPFGTGTVLSFTSGSASASLVAVTAENGKLLSATDGTLTAAGTGGTAPVLSPTAGVAAGLAINTQPSTNAIAGIPFAQQPVLAVVDAYGNVETGSSASVSVSAAVANVLGTFPTNALNGVATFAGLTLTNLGTNTLTFSAGGFATNSAVITTADEVLHIAVASGVKQVSFNGAPGYQYNLLRSTNLITGAGWVTIVTTNTTTNVVFSIIDTFPDIGATPATSLYKLLVP